jgi:small subunit ribosomal protein S6
VNDYEILLLLDAELAEERQQEIIGRTRELIEAGGGRFAAHDAWGRRKLAYEIDRKTDGSYHLLTFAAEPETLNEVSRVLKITDGVLRHLAVRQTTAKRPAAQPPVRDSGPGEGVRGNREVSSGASETPTATAEEAVSAGRPEE